MAQRFSVAHCLVVVAVAATAACETAKSANPLAPSVAGPIPGVAITQPKPLEPGTGSQLTAQESTLTTLVMENPSTTGQRTLWLEVQVASDAEFRQVVHQADRITPGEGGRTSYQIPEPLRAGFTYYWRVRALDGVNSGDYSAVASFTVVNPVVIDTPVPTQPTGAISTNRPEFIAQNGRISGTTGVVYRFQVSTSPDMTNLVAVVSATPGSNGATSMSLGELPWDRTYYWRAYATDGTTDSPFSSVVSFRTPAAPAAPSPSPTLPPSNGPVGSPRTISISEALNIVIAIHDAERWNLGSSSSRDYRIRFIQRAAAVLHYGHGTYNPKGPDSNWCIKDAGDGRPISDDVLVRCNGRESWDLISGAGANGYSFHADYIGILPSNQNVYPPPRSALP